MSRNNRVPNASSSASATERNRNGLRALPQTIRHPQNPYRTLDEELRDMVLASNQAREKKAMDRFLNTKLERDKLPEDTPLPIYLAYREPRKPSPCSRWDKTRPKKNKSSKRQTCPTGSVSGVALPPPPARRGTAIIRSASAPDTATS
ncbi:uncharacterized protein LOC108114021 [Drosophila eugracilis]|uniref:uncharacterized protein LOC108114021 n=1 Tax=Drosophila eugracilis TaxID=29029 RepID=UPI0007E5E2E1|nr:uncharacterized protein LOC108114021 [Drosophila eugracilis]